MRSKEELNKLKEEVKSVNEKLKELTPEELEQVNGGAKWAYTVGMAVGVKLKTAGQQGSEMPSRTR